MSDKEYEIEGATFAYKLGFKGDEVYMEFANQSKRCEINKVSEVIIKNTPMSSGDEISFRIVYNDGEKQKKFQWVQARVNHPATQGFLEDLGNRIPDNAEWTDKRKQAKVDSEGNKVYDIQFLLFGYKGAGLARTAQIWITMIATAVLVIPLIYFIILLVKGGYRIYTNDQGLTVRKMGDTHFTWDGLKEVDITRVNVVEKGRSGSQTDVLDLVFKDGGKSKKVVMRYDKALPLLKELQERDIISEEVVNQLT